MDSQIQIKKLDEVLDEHEEAEPVRPKPRADDEMDITPMIDITFLLLIFFLVTSTPDQQTAIELPDAQHGSPVSQLTSTVFTVADGGLDSAPVYEADGKIEAHRLSEDDDKQKEEIKEAVETGLAQENKTDVIIKADKAVRCREINRVMKAISRVEGIKIHLAILTDG
jgi:biopolymer transport protein ExbD